MNVPTDMFDGEKISYYYLCDRCGNPVCALTKRSNKIVLQEIKAPIYATGVNGEIFKINPNHEPFYIRHYEFCNHTNPERSNTQ